MYNKVGMITMLLTALVACTPKDQADNSNRQPIPELPVKIINLGDAQSFKDYPAVIEGKENIEIRVQANGYLDKVYVEEGSYVKKGQLLFKINDAIYLAQVEKDKANLLSSVSTLENAKLEVEKTKPLTENKVFSQVQLKNAINNLNIAKANFQQAKAKLNESKINLNFTYVKAPVSGYIGRIPKRIGNLVSVSDVTPLTTLSDVSKVYVYFSLSETDYFNLVSNEKDLLKKKVDLILPNGELYKSPGQIEMIDGQFNKTTGAITIRANFPNSSSLLRTGVTATIRLSEKYHNVLLVPQIATTDIQNKVFVFTLDSHNKVTKKQISLFGKAENNYIVSSGLKIGDKIVIGGVESLADNTIIKPIFK
ncbi:hypothetical protein BBI01_17925 [Chryseobacterium artocarpi]|uniref:Uncharacterized protein n=1 Tax=Chryseobacterium artocarpi TaxID=1414727 RepID=A0A1B8ZBW5_9FLAO|nr:efflux RND transporter periplasmic adaptor subunit [Chryseobacterium artocarpi]OCA69090.1 hypothetical protein BBI01_17925 [Chryseobacterium artocarpi]